MSFVKHSLSIALLASASLLIGCASCTARSATRRSAAPPAAPSAPTT